MKTETPTASEPTSIISQVNGIFFASPPIKRISCSSDIAWITEPAAKNSSALKKAWLMRWKIATG